MAEVTEEKTQGSVVFLTSDSVESYWVKDLLKEFRPDAGYIASLMDDLLLGRPLAPVIVVNDDGRYLVVDGHHRLYAYRLAGIKHMPAIVLSGGWESTESLRQADRLLKKYDDETGHRYGVGAALKLWAMSAGDGLRTTRPERLRLLAALLSRSVSRLRRRIFRILVT